MVQTMLKIDAKIAEIETKLASRKGKPSYIYFLLAAYSQLWENHLANKLGIEITKLAVLSAFENLRYLISKIPIGTESLVDVKISINKMWALAKFLKNTQLWDSN